VDAAYLYGVLAEHEPDKALADGNTFGIGRLIGVSVAG
jgi:hypothetical protein